MNFVKYCCVQILWTIAGAVVAVLMYLLCGYLNRAIEYFWAYVFLLAFVLLNVYIWWGDYKRKVAHHNRTHTPDKRWPE